MNQKKEVYFNINFPIYLPDYSVFWILVDFVLFVLENAKSEKLLMNEIEEFFLFRNFP